MREDHLGRKFKKLRISLTSICNFACVYCVSDEEARSNQKVHTCKPLSAEEFAILISKLHTLLDLEEIRLTGGEPTIYPDLIKLILYIKEIGIPKVSITTNGYRLTTIAPELKKVKLDSLNISLDAINSEVFAKMSRGRKLEKTLSGIKAAYDNKIPFKINATIMRNWNETEILPLLDFSKKMGVTIRYLELMQMGHLSGNQSDTIFTEKEILQCISQKFSYQKLHREKSSTANYYITEDGYRFGIIANESTPFCSDCNRLRLDSQGSLYGCLSSNHAFSIREAVNSNIPLEPILYQALLKKQNYKFTGSPISMMAIGG